MSTLRHRAAAAARLRRVMPILTLAAALAVAAPASAQIIDDFETGTFSLGPDSTDSVPVGPGHALSPSRGVTTRYGASAALTSTVADDGAILNGPGGWQVALDWSPTSPVDLTYGGAYDRFIFRMIASDSTAIWVTVMEGPAMYTAAVETYGGLDPEILFSDFSNSDLTDFHQVTSVSVVFGDIGLNPLVGSYATVWDIRVGRSALGFASVDAINQQFNWCPGCPPEFSVVDVSAGSARGTWQKYERIADVSPADLVGNIRVDSFDGGGGVGLWGQSLGSAVYWESTPYSSSTFEFVTELVQTGTKIPTIASPPVLTVVNPQTIALQYVLRVDDANTGALLGNSVQTVIWDVFPGQALAFQTVSATPIKPVLRSGVTDGVNLSFTLTATGPVDIALPLVTSQTTGDWAAGSTPTAATPMRDRAELAGLLAAPSVTRSGTRLTFERPRPSAGSLSVFDVTGRVARRLEFAAGATAVDWDGRADSGSALPAGVYFVSLPDPGERMTTRVVLVR